MRHLVRPSGALVRRPVRVAAAGLAVTVAATVLYAQPGTGQASAADLAMVATALSQAAGPAVPAAPGAPGAPAAPAVAAAAASADYYLKIDGIPGEATDKTHPEAIEVNSWSLGASNPTRVGGAGGGSAGKVSFSDLSVMIDQSKASPLLLLATASGKHIKSVVLTGRRSGGDNRQDYLVITLTDVLVSSFQTSASSETPMESVSLAFAKITVSYKPQGPDGRLGTAVTAGWDVAANKKV